jgi:hypothetical protein
MTRREWLALLAGALASCRAAAPSTPAVLSTAPAKPTLHLDPVVGLVPAAGLVWLVDMRPQTVWRDKVLGPAVATVVRPERLDAFARRSGGVDFREMTSFALAAYEGATLALAHVAVQPARVEAAFATRALSVEGRAVEGGVTRCWGTVREDREELALLGEEGVALARGRFEPLTAAVYFAQGRLRRALPALSAEPLAHAATLVGEAPVRAFAPGPFTGDRGGALGGLLRAATAVAAALRPHPIRGLDVALVVTGAWGNDAQLAGQRLEAAVRVLADDPVGRLLGVNHPLEEPRVSADPDALRLGLVLDSEALARGAHALGDAKIAEIMALS